MDFYKITIFNWRYKFTFNSRNFCWENGEGYRSPLIRLVSREWLTARGLANQKPWFLLRFRPIRALGYISNKKKRLIKRNRREPSEESAISGEEVRKKVKQVLQTRKLGRPPFRKNLKICRMFWNDREKFVYFLSISHLWTGRSRQ